MSLTDLIKRRKDIDIQEGEGVDLAIYLINEFKGRRFTFIGFKKKYSGVNGEDLLELLQREVNSTLLVYRYTTKIKKYIDRKGISQMQIRLMGKASMMSRYNILDTELNIKTETPRK